MQDYEISRLSTGERVISERVSSVRSISIGFWIGDAFAERGSKLLSPHRSTRAKPPRDQEDMGRHYKRRWAVERLFSWLAAWRRLANRWERRADHYWQWLCLGISLIYLRRRYWP